MTLLLTAFLSGFLEVESQESSNKEAIKSLIVQLAEGEDFYLGYELAAKLGKYGEEAVPQLITALNSTNSNTRKWAARALTNMGAEKAKSASAALLKALQAEKDEKALWYIVQAVGKVRADPKESVPALAKIMENASLEIRRIVVSTIQELGPDASEAKHSLLQALLTDDESLQTSIIRALASIGLDESDLELRRNTPAKLTAGGAWMTFLKLSSHPEWALAFLEKNPKVLEGSHRDPSELMSIVDRTDAESGKLRTVLLDHPALPASVMAWTMQPRYVPKLKEMYLVADPYSRTFLSSCARACGEPADIIVKINPGTPGAFRPSSAWPGFERSREVPEMTGHGDGFARVLVSGKLELTDGSPLVEPRFFNLNDRMLLGQKRNDRAQVKYDAKSRRFVFLTTVFAAYSRGEGQREPGPYQTGSAKIRIEAKNAKPLQVEFYDEMPEVAITLDPLK